MMYYLLFIIIYYVLTKYLFPQYDSIIDCILCFVEPAYLPL